MKRPLVPPILRTVKTVGIGLLAAVVLLITGTEASAARLAVFRGGSGLRRLVLPTGLADARRQCHLWAGPGGDRQGQRTDRSRNL